MESDCGLQPGVWADVNQAPPDRLRTRAYADMHGC